MDVEMIHSLMNLGISMVYICAYILGIKEEVIAIASLCIEAYMASDGYTHMICKYRRMYDRDVVFMTIYTCLMVLMIWNHVENVINHHIVDGIVVVGMFLDWW